MKLEKRIAKLKVDLAHIGGGFLIGISLMFLVGLRELESTFSLITHFAMFLTLFLLGLSFFGEKYDQS